jgi:hypothetical protein
MSSLPVLLRGGVGWGRVCWVRRLPDSRQGWREVELAEGLMVDFVKCEK